MKIGGVEVSRCEEVLVLPRMGGDLVFRAAAVISMEEFDAVCPKPEPPVRITKNGKEPNLTADSYVKMLQNWSEQRYAWMCIKSLTPSDIEWEKVKMDKPTTWPLWVEELQEAGISSTEMNRVQNLILEANALNEAKLKEARESFLRGQGKEA